MINSTDKAGFPLGIAGTLLASQIEKLTKPESEDFLLVADARRFTAVKFTEHAAPGGRLLVRRVMSEGKTADLLEFFTGLAPGHRIGVVQFLLGADSATNGASDVLARLLNLSNERGFNVVTMSSTTSTSRMRRRMNEVANAR